VDTGPSSGCCDGGGSRSCCYLLTCLKIINMNDRDGCRLEKVGV